MEQHMCPPLLVKNDVPLETSLSSPICSATKREQLSPPWEQGQPTGAGAGPCLPLLTVLFVETTAEGGFALRHEMKGGEAKVQTSRAVLLVLLLQWSSPWGKVGGEELQPWIWQLFACPTWEVLPLVSCLHCCAFSRALGMHCSSLRSRYFTASSLL